MVVGLGASVIPLLTTLFAALLSDPRVLPSLPVGANVYIMARQFDALQAPVATSLVLTTTLSAITTPLLLVALR